ncbi:MAG: segregation/condensation protein A [Oscillospiraceae bacterium]|nr:segregation/condensation protein A [Oscillospiraceae bacterium]
MSTQSTQSAGRNDVVYRLEGFEGPLDLLLFLISKHKLSIADIEISALLDQYLDYIDGIEDYDFEYAGDFLEMAARLILIKTLYLLPKHEEAVELKHELEGKLTQYSVCKQAAEKLSQLYVGDKVFASEPTLPELPKTYVGHCDPQALIDAYVGIFDKKMRERPVEASVFKPLVSHRVVSVSTGIVSVLKRLYKTGTCPVSVLLDGISGKSEKIAAFLAVLELAKSGRVSLNDDNTEITLNRRKTNGVQ